jgi:hypothetical protein
MSFSRLIRFEDVGGNEHFGEPQIENADDLSRLLENGELFAHVLDGISPFNLSSQAGAVHQVKRILPVLRPADVPIIKCVGLNYIKHSESGSPFTIRLILIFQSPRRRTEPTAIPVDLYQAIRLCCIK